MVRLTWAIGCLGLLVASAVTVWAINTFAPFLWAVVVVLFLALIGGDVLHGFVDAMRDSSKRPPPPPPSDV